MFEISKEMIVTFGIIIIYLIIISIFGDKYNTLLANLKRNRLAYTHKKVTDKKYQETKRLNSEKIKKLKKHSIISIMLIYLLHASIIKLIIGSLNIHIWEATIISIVAIAIMVGVFWLKGAGTIDSNPRLPNNTRI